MQRFRISTCLFAVLGSVAGGQTMDRTKPPETPPIPPFHLPPTFETKLPNGLSVVLLEDNRFPLVTVRLAFAAGSRFDPADLPGLSEGVASLLTEGTKKRNSRQIAEEVASIGASLTAQASPDSLTIGGSSLSEHSDLLLDLLADVARNAAFPPDEVELYKQNRQQKLLEQHSRSDFLAEEQLQKTLFGNHPYGRVGPTSESVNQLSIEKLMKFRDTYLAPNNAVLILLGKLPKRQDALKAIADRLGSWERRTIPAQPIAAPPAPHKSIQFVDRPGSVQADIHIGHVGLARTSGDYFPLVVGSAILGGGTSSRLFNDIREKNGYAYSVYSHQLPLKDSGTFSTAMQVRNEVAGPALDAMLANMVAMSKEAVTAAELSDVKNFLSGSFVLRLQTQDGLASQLAIVKGLGLPNDYLENFTTRLRSVEPDQIQAVAKKIISPEESSIVVVGDGKQILPALEKFGKVEVIKPK